MSSSGARSVALLGSTGSIGTQTLDVIGAAPDRFRVESLCAGGNDLPALAAQAVACRPSVVGVSRAGVRDELSGLIAAHWPTGEPRPEVIDGPGSAAEIAAREADIVLNAVAGHQGLRATISALDAGRTVALANKESLISGGRLVLDRAKPGQLVPVDSEHSALAQCLRGGRREEVRRLVVTASGGPFRGPASRRTGRGHGRAGTGSPDVADGSAGHDQQRHPGQQGARGDRSGPAVRVRRTTGSRSSSIPSRSSIRWWSSTTGPPSRRPARPTCVSRSRLLSAWPDRVPGAAAADRLDAGGAWTFDPLDDDAFPAVALARRAGQAAGCAPAVYNAANEDLVAAFLDGRCEFLDISDVIARVLEIGSRTSSPNEVNPVPSRTSNRPRPGPASTYGPNWPEPDGSPA